MIFDQKKKKVVLNRPIQLGVSILEFAKLIMFSYYHDILKKTFGPRINLLYTDTDSFVVQLWTRNLLQDLESIAHTLDTSNFPSEGHYLSSLYTSEFTSELFYFKSEVGADEIIAFAAIRAKVYSLISSSGTGENEIIEILNKLKGVNRSCVDMIGEYSLYYYFEMLFIHIKSKYIIFRIL